VAHVNHRVQLDCDYPDSPLPAETAEVEHLITLSPLPGRSAAQARDEFLVPLRRALSCITTAQLYVASRARPGAPEVLALSQDPLQLRSAKLGTVQLLLGHQYGTLRPIPAVSHAADQRATLVKVI
jgi:hypothetical protein